MAPSTKIRQFVRSNGIGLAAVYLALGGTALALPGKNSVNSGDIANGQVKAGDIGSGQVKGAELAGDAVTSAKVANGSVTGADIANGSLSGDDIDDGTLAPVWSALTGVPAGFADGIDNEGSGGGPATNLNCTGCVGAIDIGNGQVGPAHIGLPLSLTGSGGTVLEGHNTAGFGSGVSALASTAGGTALKAAAIGEASRAVDIDGTMTVDGSTQDSPNTALLDASNPNSSFGSALWGHTTSGLGVRGTHTGDGGWGMFAESLGDNGRGLVASASGLLSSGVVADASGASGRGVSGGASGSSGIGVRAAASGPAGVALHAVVGGSATKAGEFLGDVSVTGQLSKSAGSFRIDHPLDPANKYLQHSFVESPEMMNIYNGLVTTDRRGFATVTMPDWFDALNRDFRYQLTVLGRSFARAIIWEKLDGERFVIRSDAPRVEVSWQVTGVREDVYAKENPIAVEPAKTGEERGRYLYPQGYGEPERQAIGREATRARQR